MTEFQKERLAGVLYTVAIVMLISGIAGIVLTTIYPWCADAHSIDLTIPFVVSGIVLAVGLIASVVYAAICPETILVRNISASGRVAEPVEVGATLTEAMDYIRQLEYEVEVCADEDGNVLMAGTYYDPCICSVAQADWKKFGRSGLVTAHNHPTSNPAFSGQDIESMISCRERKCFVVTKDYTYSLENPTFNKRRPSSEGKEARKRLNKLREQYIIWEILFGWRVYNWLVRRVAKEYGLIFEAKRVTPYIDWRRTKRARKAIAQFAGACMAVILAININQTGLANPAQAVNSAQTVNKDTAPRPVNIEDGRDETVIMFEGGDDQRHLLHIANADLDGRDLTIGTIVEYCTQGGDSWKDLVVYKDGVEWFQADRLITPSELAQSYNYGPGPVDGF